MDISDNSSRCIKCHKDVPLVACAGCLESISKSNGSIDAIDSSIVTKNGVNGDNKTSNQRTTNKTPDQMTSRDYYWDSYAHFAIHEEMIKVS